MIIDTDKLRKLLEINKKFSPHESREILTHFELSLNMIEKVSIKTGLIEGSPSPLIIQLNIPSYSWARDSIITREEHEIAKKFTSRV